MKWLRKMCCPFRRWNLLRHTINRQPSAVVNLNVMTENVAVIKTRKLILNKTSGKQQKQFFLLLFAYKGKQKVYLSFFFLRDNELKGNRQRANVCFNTRCLFPCNGLFCCLSLNPLIENSALNVRWMVKIQDGMCLGCCHSLLFINSKQKLVVVFFSYMMYGVRSALYSTHYNVFINFQFKRGFQKSHMNIKILAFANTPSFLGNWLAFSISLMISVCVCVYVCRYAMGVLFKQISYLANFYSY